MTEEIDRRPSRFGITLSTLLALLVAVLALPYSGVGAVFGGFGLGFVAVATYGGYRRVVDLGGLALALAVVGIGSGVPSAKADPLAGLVLLSAAVAAVLSWDVAGNAIEVGEQLGRSADTVRAEASHALGSLVLGAFVSGIAFGIFQSAAGGQPVTALVFMLVAMLVLVSALRL